MHLLFWWWLTPLCYAAGSGDSNRNISIACTNEIGLSRYPVEKLALNVVNSVRNWLALRYSLSEMYMMELDQSLAEKALACAQANRKGPLTADCTENAFFLPGLTSPTPKQALGEGWVIISQDVAKRSRKELLGVYACLQPRRRLAFCSFDPSHYDLTCYCLPRGRGAEREGPRCKACPGGWNCVASVAELPCRTAWPSQDVALCLYREGSNESHASSDANYVEVDGSSPTDDPFGQPTDYDHSAGVGRHVALLTAAITLFCSLF